MITFGTGRAAKQYVAVLYTSPREAPPKTMRYAPTPAGVQQLRRPNAPSLRDTRGFRAGSPALLDWLPTEPPLKHVPHDLKRARRTEPQERCRRSPATG